MELDTTPENSEIIHSKCLMYNNASDNCKDKLNLSNSASFIVSNFGIKLAIISLITNLIALDVCKKLTISFSFKNEITSESVFLFIYSNSFEEDLNRNMDYE